MLRSFIKLQVLGMESRQSLQRFLDKLRRDEGGASLVEYSILVGLISVAVIAAIVAVGDWVEQQWSTLDSSLT